MCKFDEAWIGVCKKESVAGKEYCSEHEAEVCSVCGEQATHNCDETMQLVCGFNLCDKLECKLQHFYQSHGYAIHSLIDMEQKLNRTPFKLVVSKVNMGTGELAEWFNEHYKDRLELLIITHDASDNMKVYRSHFPYFVKQKEEISQLFERTWYEKEVEKKGVYYSPNPIHITEPFTMEMFNQLEKVDLQFKKSEEKIS